MPNPYSPGEEDPYAGSPYGQADQRLAASYHEESRGYETEDNRRYEVENGGRYDVEDSRQYEEDSRHYDGDDSRRYEIDDRRYISDDDRRYIGQDNRRYEEDNSYGNDSRYYPQDVDDKYKSYTTQDRQQIYEEDGKIHRDVYRSGSENHPRNMQYHEDIRNGSYDERSPVYGYESSNERTQVLPPNSYLRAEYEEENPYGTRGVNGQDRYEGEDEYPSGSKLSETYPEETNYGLSPRDAHLKRVQPERDVYLASGGDGELPPNDWEESDYNLQQSHWSPNTQNRSAPNFPGLYFIIVLLYWHTVILQIPACVFTLVSMFHLFVLFYLHEINRRKSTRKIRRRNSAQRRWFISYLKVYLCFKIYSYLE